MKNYFPEKEYIFTEKDCLYLLKLLVKKIFSKNFDSFYLYVHALILTCTINF